MSRQRFALFAPFARVTLFVLVALATLDCQKTLRLHEGDPLRIQTKVGTFAFFAGGSHIDITPEGADRVRLDLSAETPSGTEPVRLGETAIRDRSGRKYTLAAQAGTTRFDVQLEVDEAHGIVLVTPVPARKAPPIALRIDTIVPRAPWIPTVGLAPEAASGPFAMFGSTLAAGFHRCGSHVTTSHSESDGGEGALHVVLSRDPASRADAAPTSDGGAECAASERTMFFAAGSSSAAAIAHAYRARGVALHPVRARVRGATARVQLFALDRSSKPVFKLPWKGDSVPTTEPMTFDFEAPALAEAWYAAIDSTETSPTRTYVPGGPGELVLDVSPGGELSLRVFDPDRKKRLVSRVVIRGIDGTPDPSFGPDHRASGAGPLLDLRDGELTTPLPQGRYRVRATKGLEWSIDSHDVDVASGQTTKLELELRQVVATPKSIGCDLHVHARPSFDAPVTMEDRVLSLVAQGVDFAVPTEHNVVGNYAPGIALLDLGSELSTVPGVEVTTYDPRFGHFGVFPYTVGGTVPPYRGVNAALIFDVARRGDPKRVIQVNHPRLSNGIGYFQVTGFDPNRPIYGKQRLGFDTVEVYNGYEVFERDRVEVVLKDFMGLLNHGQRVAATGSSDSHRIQYQWAGYPRTMVQIDPRDDGRVDTAEVVANIKSGRSSVTSGPVIDVAVTGKEPGGEVTLRPGSPVTVHVKVAAAPWIDVKNLEVIVNGERVADRAWAQSAMKVGREAGTLEEARARTVRFEGDITFTMPAHDSWLMVVARGERRLDDAIPFMPLQPLGFTNPVWLRVKK